jgi:hypothetical protein
MVRPHVLIIQHIQVLRQRATKHHLAVTGGILLVNIVHVFGHQDLAIYLATLINLIWLWE